MNSYTFTFVGRTRGAIGRPWLMTETVLAESLLEAEETVRAAFEVWHVAQVETTSEKGGAE